MNRRSIVASVGILPAAQAMQSATPAASPVATHVFGDIRESSMFYASKQYEIEREGDPLILDSWACGYIAHPASRSTYRQYPNAFEGGMGAFELPGLPVMVALDSERSADIFGEDAVLASVANPDDADSQGAIAVCQNGVLVQVLCLHPAIGLAADEAVESVRSIAASMHERDPEFYGRGEMTRSILQSRVTQAEDLHTAFERVRLISENYLFRMDDGVSDFWE